MTLFPKSLIGSLLLCLVIYAVLVAFTLLMYQLAA